MLDDNVAQTLTIIIPILAAVFGLGYFLMKQISAAESRLNERIDRTDGDVVKVHEEVAEVRRDLTKVREDLAEVKGKVDLMAAIVTKSENERMAEAIIALETRRASVQSE